MRSYRRLAWSDIAVPAELVEVVDEISYQRVVMNPGATWDYFPGHYDPRYAESHGHPTIFVNTMHLAGFIDRIATDWAGPYSRVVRRKVSMVGREGRPDWAQNEYSLLDREAEEGVLEVCTREGLGFTPFSPLAGGWLTGKYRRDEEPPAGSRMTLRPEPYLHLRTERVFDALEAFAAHAAERGTTPATLAFAWLLAHPHVTAVVVGPRRPEQLRPALDALELALSPPERDQLTELFA